MKSYLSGRAGCLYRQTASSWNVLDTLSNIIICHHLSAIRRFCHVPEPSMKFHEVLQSSVRFHGIPWSFMRFYDVPVNQSVPTEANKGLTSYTEIKAESIEFIVWQANSSDLYPIEDVQKHHKALLEDLCFEVKPVAKHVEDHCKKETRCVQHEYL
jgi:hypothetical protein